MTPLIVWGANVSWNYDWNVEHVGAAPFVVSYNTSPDSISSLMGVGYTTTELDDTTANLNSYGKTNYACVLGATDANPGYGGYGGSAEETYNHFDGICTNRSKTKNVVDGESNTLIFGEVSHFVEGDNSNIDADTGLKVGGPNMVYTLSTYECWMGCAGYGVDAIGIGQNAWIANDDGVDNNLDELYFFKGSGFSSYHPSATNFVTADGASRSLSHSIDVDVLFILAGKNDYGLVDWSQLD